MLFSFSTSWLSIFRRRAVSKKRRASRLSSQVRGASAAAWISRREEVLRGPCSLSYGISGARGLRLPRALVPWGHPSCLLQPPSGSLLRQLFRTGVLIILGMTTVLTAGCFPKSAGLRLAHFDAQAPQLGEPAPDIALEGVDGYPFELSQWLGGKPIVVQLGSHSCPVYRHRRHWMKELVEDYGERVNFLIVDTLEAHPTGAPSPYADREWRTWLNRLSGVSVPQPEEFEQRRRQARSSREALGLSQLMVVDELNNSIWLAYGGASSPAFVVAGDGRVASRQVWLDPEEIRRVLDRLLADEVKAGAASEAEP